MNKSLSLFYVFVLLLSFSSCTKDNDDNISNNYSSIVGVWEQEGFMDVSGQRLVFAPDQTGIKIFKSTDGEFVTSTASMCSWEYTSNMVTVYEVDVVIGVYTLSSEGQLISENSEELPFDKISDTTLDYY